MDKREQSQNMKIEINNPLRVSNPNANNVSGSKMSPNEEYLSKEISKFNQFMFTPLESFILNKKMPRGFKFESEENMSKTLELSKNNLRKVKQKGFLQEPKIHIKPMKSNINENKKNLAEKDQTSRTSKKSKKIENEISKNISNSNINNNNNTNISKIEGNNSEAYKVRIKCTSGFNKIKSSPGANLFYSSKIIDAPSLSKIEKKIINFEYKTLNECFDDIRKVWNYQFKNHAKDPGIYQNICKLSSFTESVYKELLAEKNTFNEKKEGFSLIKKRAEKLKKDLEEINGNTQKEIYNKNVKVKNTASIIKLSQMIRLLTKTQLKGIIPILWEKNEKSDQKTYEFDLDKLPDDKFKNLETYVINCFNENKNTNFNNKNLNLHNQNKKENKNNGINNGIKKNGNIISNGIYKNNINHQNSAKKEENKKVDNSFSDSDSMSSNSSL